MIQDVRLELGQATDTRRSPAIDSGGASIEGDRSRITTRFATYDRAESIGSERDELKEVIVGKEVKVVTDLIEIILRYWLGAELFLGDGTKSIEIVRSLALEILEGLGIGIHPGE